LESIGAVSARDVKKAAEKGYQETVTAPVTERFKADLAMRDDEHDDGPSLDELCPQSSEFFDDASAGDEEQTSSQGSGSNAGSSSQPSSAVGTGLVEVLTAIEKVNHTFHTACFVQAMLNTHHSLELLFEPFVRRLSVARSGWRRSAKSQSTLTPYSTTLKKLPVPPHPSATSVRRC
jgi:hypothetical protein